MPVYEYECAGCGHQFEEFQKISDKPIKTCPVCKKRKVKKLISQSTFVLKGSGWYATDYGTKKDHTASSKSESKTDKTADTKTDKKSDSKSDSATKDSSTKTESKSDSSTATTNA